MQGTKSRASTRLSCRLNPEKKAESIQTNVRVAELVQSRKVCNVNTTLPNIIFKLIILIYTFKISLDRIDTVSDMVALC